jgi:hypothetical protein
VSLVSLILSVIRQSAGRLLRVNFPVLVHIPAPVEQAEVRPAVAGDVGHPSPELALTVSTIVAEHERRPFAALILLGDNIYPDGDPGRADEAVLGLRIVVLHHPPYSAGWHGSSRHVRRTLLR